MDLLDFESQDLYFDEPLIEEAKQCIDSAAERYSGDTDEDGAEEQLMRAYFLAPEHPLVLVALYRYFYYSHRLHDSLIIAERVLKIFAQRMDLPSNWQQLSQQHVQESAENNMTAVRFYLLALKGAGFLEMRLEKFQNAQKRLQKVLELDSKDRLGAQALLELLNTKISSTE